MARVLTISKRGNPDAHVRYVYLVDYVRVCLIVCLWTSVVCPYITRHLTPTLTLTLTFSSYLTTPALIEGPLGCVDLREQGGNSDLPIISCSRSRHVILVTPTGGVSSLIIAIMHRLPVAFFATYPVVASDTTTLHH